MERLVARCLEREIDRRPGAADEILRALDGAAGLPPSGPPHLSAPASPAVFSSSSAPTAFPPPSRAPRRRWLRGGLVMGGVAVVGALVAIRTASPGPGHASAAPGATAAHAQVPAVPPPAEQPKPATPVAPAAPGGASHVEAVAQPVTSERRVAPPRAVRRDRRRPGRRPPAGRHNAATARRHHAAGGSRTASPVGRSGRRVHFQMRTLLVAAAVLASWVAAPARGAAQVAQGGAAPPAGAEAAADVLIEQAARAYDQSRLDEALGLLARAYELSARPSILYNRAQVLRAKDDCAAALDAYSRFVAETTQDDPNRDRASRRRDEMQACVDRRKAEAATSAPAPAAEAPVPAGTHATPRRPAGGHRACARQRGGRRYAPRQRPRSRGDIGSTRCELRVGR